MLQIGALSSYLRNKRIIFYSPRQNSSRCYEFQRSALRHDLRIQRNWSLQVCGQKGFPRSDKSEADFRRRKKCDPRRADGAGLRKSADQKINHPYP
ncbi:hypothetical protein NIASO_16080 [Niabella soli DSM 19437]|uniref:Uncharacterized protein n=1 Tax=Niabella soli DSM 19437 TaxID=929713 RepID=W0F496_9BACT|nr:hypothetical protein NIASO_16080 [Niabella soli DSM 19437]